MQARSVARPFLLACAAAALAAAPAQAGLLIEVPTAVSFQVADESMWDLANAVSSVQKFVGKRWPASGPGSVTKTLPVKRTAIPSVNASFTMGSSGQFGVDFSAKLDTGSVDASFAGIGSIAVTEAASPVAGARLYRIATAELPGSTASMSTKAPNVEVKTDFVARMDATVQATGKVVLQPQRRICGLLGNCVVIPEVSHTGTLPKTEVIDFDIRQELFSLTNQDIKVFGNSIKDKNPIFREESGEEQLAITIDLGFDPVEWVTGTGAGVDVRVTDESNPKKPRKSKNADPKDIVSLAFSMGDLTLYAPVLDTATSEFRTEDGKRFLTTSGDTKLAKVDLDMDFLATAIAGVASGGSATIPLGITAELGVGPIKFTAEADIIDADLGAVLFGNQVFTFVPELAVTLDFGRKVMFREVGTEAWTEGRFASGAAGVEFEVLHDGAGDLVVKSTYTLPNDFTNTTSLSVGQQFAMDVLKFSLSAPFNIPLVGPVQVAQFLQESEQRVSLGNVFDKTFALDFQGIAGQAITLGGVPLDVGLDAAFAAELVTGSPASLIQQVATPEGPFDIVFDYLFESLTGELSVLLGGLAVGQLAAPGTLAGDFLTATFSILDPSLFDLDTVALTFLFDGPEGSRLLLDGIFFRDGAGRRFAVDNGDFQAGNLGRWVGLSSGEGSVRVRRLGVAEAPAVPEPAAGAVFALAAAFLIRRAARGA